MGFSTFQLPVYILAGICIVLGEMSLCLQTSSTKRGLAFGGYPALPMFNPLCLGSSKTLPISSSIQQNKTSSTEGGSYRCCQKFSLLCLFFLLECFTANGADYRGMQNWTALQGGKPCLFWNETFQHPYNTLKYPNGEGGVGEHNYCR